MTRVEYRIELAPFHEAQETKGPEFLARLNELGKEGWRLVAINPLEGARGGWVPSTATPMLLSREISDDPSR